MSPPPPTLTAKGAGKKQALTERLCFVSLLERRQVEGIELIRTLTESHGFEADHFHYHLSTKSEVSRPINPKNPQGPTKKVTIEEKVNVNGNLKGLRQFSWRAGKAVAMTWACDRGLCRLGRASRLRPTKRSSVLQNSFGPTR